MATHAMHAQRALAPARAAPRCLGVRAAVVPAVAASAAPLASRAAVCLRGAPLPPPPPLAACAAPGSAACRRRGSRTALRALAAAAAAAPPAAAVLPTPRLAALAAQFQALPEGPERYKLLLQLATQLPAMPDAGRVLENRVMGCTSQTWLTVDLAADGSVRIAGACALRPTRFAGHTRHAAGHARRAARCTPHTRLGLAVLVLRHVAAAARGAPRGVRVCDVSRRRVCVVTRGAQRPERAAPRPTVAERVLRGARFPCSALFWLNDRCLSLS
jgi:hypothetical protein